MTTSCVGASTSSRSNAESQQMRVRKKEYQISGTPHRWERPSGWPREDVCNLQDGSTKVHLRSAAVGDDQPAREILSQPSRVELAPPSATEYDTVFGVGTWSGVSLFSAQSGVDTTNRAHPLQSQSQHKSVGWCILLRSRSCPSPAKWRGLETLRFSLNDGDRKAVCSDRKGGTRNNLGLWEVHRLHPGMELSHRDWPQTSRSLLSTKHLDCLPPRVLRFHLRMARYSYIKQHVPRKLLCTADTLSRARLQTLGRVHNSSRQRWKRS